MDDYTFPRLDLSSRTTEPAPSDQLATCAWHGQPVNRNVIHVLRQTYSFDSKCPSCEREVEKRERQRERQHFELAQKEAGIPERFLTATISNFPISAPGQSDVLRKAEGFINRIGDGSPGLILTGWVGAGKTYLACAILNVVLQRKRTGRYCATVQDLLRPIKETWRARSEITERQALGIVCRLTLLVVDEVGLHELEARDRALLIEIINNRYGRQLPTIVISNLAPLMLREVVGDRVIDRFKEGGTMLIMDWPSQRSRIQETSG